MRPQTIHLGGVPYVIIPRAEFEALETLAAMPEYPQPNESGNYPAVEYCRVSIARSIVRDRVRLGLTQAELARRAGIRVETLCRIEAAVRDASVATIDKIDAALNAAEPAAKSPRRAPKRKAGAR